jgi:predicted kinase
MNTRVYPTISPHRCFMLIGPPASGKSTWRAGMLEQQQAIFDPVIISGDDLIEEECALTGETYSEVFSRHDFKEQKRILHSRFSEAVREGRDIIVDRTNLTAKARRSFLATLPKTYNKIAVVFAVPETILFERLERRGIETGKVIPRKVVEDMMASYQPPIPGEFHHIIQA